MKQGLNLQPFQKIESLIRVNMDASVRLSQIALKYSMVPKKRGLVVFVSSTAALILVPQLSLYAATKVSYKSLIC